MGYHEVFSDKDLGPIHKFLEISKGKTGLLLEKEGSVNSCALNYYLVVVKFWEETRNTSSHFANNSTMTKFFSWNAVTKSVYFS